MSTYITNGTYTFTPTLVNGFESQRQTSTIVHHILGSARPDITIRPVRWRTSTLHLVFSGPEAEDHSRGCEEAHGAGGAWFLFSDDAPTIQMNYVADGSITRTLDDTRKVWLLDIDVQEM